MNGQTIAYLLLVANQLVATIVFVIIYGRASAWRKTAVGRHLMYWAIAAGALDLSWLLLLALKWPWLIYLLFTVQAVFGLLTWQRVRLVWQAQR